MEIETGAKETPEQAVTPQAEMPAEVTPVQEKTYTQKELDAIAKEIGDKRVEGLTKALSKKDKEIEALKKIPSPSDATLPLLRKMADALGETINTGYGDEEATKKAKSKLSAINNEIATMQANTERAKTEAVRETMWNRIKEIGLDPDPNSENYDERLDPVIAFWTAGNIPLAQQRLDKLAAKIEKEKQVAEPKKEDKVDASKLEAELRAKIIKEYGLDNQDTSPKGGASDRTFKNKEEAYAKGDISYSEYMKARKEHGIT
jgi:hypothetical protein